jgi:hypothetical protein
MNAITKTITIMATGAAFLAPVAAHAQDDVETSEVPSAYSYAWRDPRLVSEVGISTILGGGITGFTNQTMRDTVTSDVGGLWNLRVTIGSHTPIGFDIGYIGTAQNINALIGTQDGTLVGTTVEGALRWNILPHFEWNPYLFAGIGWQRYDITGGTFRLSATGMRESDNSVVFPLGAGVQYRDMSGLVFDLHGAVRPNTEGKLVLDNLNTTSDFAEMHTWEASAAVGYEF